MVPDLILLNRNISMSSFLHQLDRVQDHKAFHISLQTAPFYQNPVSNGFVSSQSASVKKNLRLFNGFPFAADSQEFTRKRDKMLRNSNLTNTKLKLVCSILDLEKKGTHQDLIDRILVFLIAPKNSGKRAPVKKKRRTKKKLASGDSVAKKKKSKPRASGTKKSKPGSKSKAIVMDSSSDEDDDEKVEASVEAGGSDGEEKRSEQEEEEEEQTDQSESDESSKPKSSRGKKKKQQIPAKKRPRSQSSDGTSEAEEKPKKKKVAAAKTKKADSSSSSKNTNAAEDSSDEDEPLIRMVKKAPTDEQLRKTVESLLKEADLEEMTMKQICLKVFDTYPEHDLSSRKDFIKQTVKTLIT
uniref:DEK-C domain-containing protein n=1 Tax=Poecilia mexicana TaxID=48701 RepID=A0A3B3YUZ6_9TELE